MNTGIFFYTCVLYGCSWCYQLLRRRVYFREVYRTNREILFINDYIFMKQISCNERMTSAFKTIYRLLNRLERGLDADQFDAEGQIGSKALGITDNRWRHYIKMLQKEGYIEGADIREFNDGEESVDISEIQITIKGLEYLAKNTMMIRAYNTVKSIKDIVK